MAIQCLSCKHIHFGYNMCFNLESQSSMQIRRLAHHGNMHSNRPALYVIWFELLSDTDWPACGNHYHWRMYVWRHWEYLNQFKVSRSCPHILETCFATQLCSNINLSNSVPIINLIYFITRDSNRRQRES